MAGGDEPVAWVCRRRAYILGQNTPYGSVDSISSLGELGAVPRGMATHQIGSVGVDDVALQDDVGGIVSSLWAYSFS